MEIPHAFILNKVDEPAARRSFHALRSTIALARPDADALPILQTSAKDGTGIDELCDDMLAACRSSRRRTSDREPYFFERWVRDEWGRAGLRMLDGEWGDVTALAQ